MSIAELEAIDTADHLQEHYQGSTVHRRMMGMIFKTASDATQLLRRVQRFCHTTYEPDLSEEVQQAIEACICDGVGTISLLKNNYDMYQLEEHSGEAGNAAERQAIEEKLFCLLPLKDEQLINELRHARYDLLRHGYMLKRSKAEPEFRLEPSPAEKDPDEGSQIILWEKMQPVSVEEDSWPPDQHARNTMDLVLDDTTRVKLAATPVSADEYSSAMRNTV